MFKNHYIVIAVVAIVFYFVGASFPSFGSGALSTLKAKTGL